MTTKICGFLDIFRNTFKNRKHSVINFRSIFPKNNDSKYKIIPIVSIVYDESNIQEKIGEGGTAVVYTYDTGKFICACKKIKTNVSNILNEIYIMKTYCKNNEKHEHLPQYYTSIINTSTSCNFTQYDYIFMEYCSGIELFELLQFNLDYKLITYIIYQLLTAVAHLQKYNIIHGDIKLENIIIDSNNTIKLIDFGLAKQINEGNALRLNKCGGTIGYVSPEMLLSNYITLKTDIWSVGLVYYMLLNNSHLFNVITLNKYKEDLNILKNVGVMPSLKLNNTTIPSDQYEMLYKFLDKTICFDKKRHSVKQCLKNKIFKCNEVLV